MIDVHKSVSCLHIDIGQAIPVLSVVDHYEVNVAVCKYLKLTDNQHLTFQSQLVDGMQWPYGLTVCNLFKLVCG